MEKRKLGSFVTFIPGINPTRAENQIEMKNIIYYDQAAFESDFNYENKVNEEKTTGMINKGIALEAGDVVISNSLQMATIVGEGNAGKVPSLNFTKVEFRSNALDKQYFVYLFNVYSGVKRQKEKGLQGNGAILRIPIKELTQIVIPVVPIEQQKKIGSSYNKTLRIKSKLNKYTELMEQFAYSVLEENLKEKRQDE
ncbi:restriction endonuclease subunit S [Ohessyouella blattaphilus]|uniref:Restriction endonuclease subunit S n=1 Tax=Ohessyouella blattaphilus TaxID=2949333 RepID=A0ABT1EDY0_9FIRM|nr:restriction endonuclease subunit S [Ohessyouella blattaphilus]MCP1108914.1 restriction endonuclease subunit S [Ohessyouella blattaphilus]MCR8562308.1 restriction endonuclease subunit S [Ohessyouella blattaphilus]